MIIIGDKIKLIQKLGKLDKVGDVFDVTGVDNGVISFKCSYGEGCMTYNEFEKYFEKVEEPVKIVRVWTIWEPTMIHFRNPFTTEYCSVGIEMRENGKKIQVRYKNIRAEASCHKEDEFSASRGFELAKRRLILKLLYDELKNYAQKL